MRPARFLAAFALLALPLAGCTVPGPASPPTPVLAAGEGPPALPVDAGGLAEVDAAVPAAQGVLPEPADILACSPEPQRDERATATEVVVTVVGCAAAVVPLLGGLPEDVRADVEVGPGARAMHVRLHLHGGNPLAATLLDPWYPWDEDKHPREGQGSAEQDTVLAWDLDAPHDGLWRLQGGVQELSAGRRWTATVIVTYA